MYIRSSMKVVGFWRVAFSKSVAGQMSCIPLCHGTSLEAHSQSRTAWLIPLSQKDQDVWPVARRWARTYKSRGRRKPENSKNGSRGYKGLPQRLAKPLHAPYCFMRWSV